MKSMKVMLFRFWGIAVMVMFLHACTGSARDQNRHNDAKPSTPQSELGHLSGSNQIDKNIRSIYQDRSLNYWFGTNGAGVYRYDSKTLTQYTVKDGLADNQVINIQEDAEGNLWFGAGSFRISKYDGHKFTTQSDHFSMADWGNVKLGSNEHARWFCAGGGVFRHSNASLEYLPFSNSYNTAQPADPFALTRFAVYCILEDRKGHVWFGTQAEGVCRFDGSKLTWFKEKGLAGPAVLALFEDSKGNIWFGNNGAGLFRYDGSSLSNFTADNGLGNADFLASGTGKPGTMARVYAINEDRSGNIWVGTVDAGVWKYDGNALTNYTTLHGLTSNAVNTIYKDRDGGLWFGTDGDGICRFDGARFSEFVMWMEAPNTPFGQGLSVPSAPGE